MRLEHLTAWVLAPLSCNRKEVLAVSRTQAQATRNQQQEELLLADAKKSSCACIIFGLYCIANYIERTINNLKQQIRLLNYYPARVPFSTWWWFWYFAILKTAFHVKLGMCILTFSAGFKSAGHHYRIYSNKRRPRLSAASGTKKLISAAPPMQRLFEEFHITRKNT